MRSEDSKGILLETNNFRTSTFLIPHSSFLILNFTFPLLPYWVTELNVVGQVPKDGIAVGAEVQVNFLELR